jgi:serine protease Do
MKKILISGLILICLFNGFSQSKDNSQALKNVLDMQNVFRQIAHDIIPKVVRIDVTSVSADKTTGKSFGSGIIVEQEDEDVYILTNYHVINNATEITIVLNNDKEYKGETVGKDERSDIGVVKFQSKEKFEVAKIGKSSELQIGDWAIAVGNPYGFNGTVTIGVVSALGRSTMLGNKADATDFIQTDAAVNPGNSGGPLINIKGEVIGINSWIASPIAANSGLSFSIPIDNAIVVFSKLKKNSVVEYAWLGVAIKSLTDSALRKSLNIEREHGAYIVEIVKESPGEKAGFKVGDIIISIDGKEIKDANELIWIISKYNPGDKIKVKYISEDVTKEVFVILATRPSANNSSKPVNIGTGKELSFLGGKYSTIDPKYLENMGIENISGVVITKVDRNTPANDYGLQVGDIVRKINTTEIKKIDDLESFISKSTKANIDAFYFYIIRDGRELIIGVQK